jgi:hypothetical protein
LLTETRAKRTGIKNELTCDPNVDLVASIVSAVFRQFGWQYHDGMPGQERLQETISELASSLVVGDSKTSESGRLLVTRDDNQIDVYVHAGAFAIPGYLLDPRESESASPLPEGQ